MALQVEWPFLVCLVEVLFFFIAALVVLYKFESFRESGKKSSTLGSLQKNELSDCCAAELHPSWLCAFRAIAFLYMLPIQVYNLVIDGPKVYLFYTQWTFTLLIIYFGLATWSSVKELYFTKEAVVTNRFSEDETFTNDIEEGEVTASPGLIRSKARAGFIGYAMLLAFQVVAPAVLLTDTVYWFILVPFVLRANAEHGVVDVSMHAVNAVFLFGEFFLNSMPFAWFRGGYFVLWTVVYLFLQWTLHAANVVDWWPYPFLQVATPWAPLWYFGLAIVNLVVFLICLGLAKAKRPLVSYFTRS